MDDLAGAEPLVGFSHPQWGNRVAFSVAETAELLGVTDNTVRAAIREERLVAISVIEGGRSTRIPAWSIDALLARPEGLSRTRQEVGATG